MSFDQDSAFVAAKLCNDFVYFAGKGPYYTPHRAFMTLDGFRQFVGQHYGILTYTRIVDGKEVTDTIPAAEWWLNTRPEGKRVVSEIVFEPGVRTVPEKFNTWDTLRHEMCPCTPNSSFESIRPLVEHLLYLSEDHVEAITWVIHWLAHLYQFPNVKIPSFIVFHSDLGGVGKSMLKLLLSPVFGASMVRSMGGHHLHSEFSDTLFGARLVFMEEVAFENRRSTYEKFKDLVSEPQFTHRPLGRAAFPAMNTAHFIVNTNRIDALPLMAADRRALVLSCPHKPKSQQYYRDLVAWMKGPGPGLLASVLSTLPLNGFDAGARPPMTEAAGRMHDESKPALDRFIADLIEERTAPFDRDFGYPKAVIDYLSVVHQASTANMGFNAHSLGRALRASGAVKKFMRVSEEGNPKWVWIWRNHERWNNESPGARAAHLA